MSIETKPGQAHARRATFIGLLAVPMWALLPALTKAAGDVPPLQLVATTFAIGATLGAIALATDRDAWAALRNTPKSAFLLGIAGFFGFHFAYFLALRNAPVVEANLINNLWPILIVLLSAALPKRVAPERLTLRHVLAGALSFFGAALVVAGGASLSGGPYLFGYGMALIAALTWSSYSVLSRLFSDVPTASVAVSCAGTAVLAAATHSFLEPTTFAISAKQAVAILAMGILPVGAAFYVWDFGCKHGDLRVMGVASYFGPVLATIILVSLGFAEPSFRILIAALFISAGAVIASSKLFSATPG